MELIYLSIIFVAIASVFVIIYLCFILKRVSDTMKSLGTTMSEVEEKLKYITPQLTETVQGTDKLINDVEEKVKATDSLFDSVEEFGKSITSANEALNQRFGKLTDEEMDQKVKPFIEGIKWSEVAVRLYSSYQINKKDKQNEIIIRDKNAVAEVSRREG